MTSMGYAIHNTKEWDVFKTIEYPLKKVTPDDIDIAITHCGVCGSDVHTITGGWGAPLFLPLVVGHEIVGTVTAVGENVKDVNVGDRVGLGAMCYSCQKCVNCKHENENYCLGGGVDTYNDRLPTGEGTQGGYASKIRAHQKFVFPVPEALKSEHAAPMMCAGLTCYSPLVRNNVGPNSRVGIVGIGGLGHFGLLFASALGAEVIAISHSPSKREDALKFGAKEFVSTKENPGWWDEERNQASLDLVISSANSSQIDTKKILKTLKPGGKLIFVGLPEDSLGEFRAQNFSSHGSYIGASHLGNRQELLSMLKLAAEKKIEPTVEVLKMAQVSEAIRRMKTGDVRYRFVLEQDLS